MKIIKQLSDDVFIVQMEQFDHNQEKHIIVAHDYVRFLDNSGIQSDYHCEPLTGPYERCSNWINAQHETTIDIRSMIQVVLPFLNKHEYCQKEHLLYKDGSPAYTWSNTPIFFYEDGKEKVAVHESGETEIHIMTKEEYNQYKQEKENKKE